MLLHYLVKCTQHIVHRAHETVSQNKTVTITFAVTLVILLSDFNIFGILDIN